MRFSLHRARSVEDALALAAGLDSRWRYVAGGTDLVVQIRRGARTIDDLIDLSAITTLRGIAAADGRYRLGALCTHKDVERDAALREDFPALHAAARLVGGHQIRNVGTIGGNLGNASPAADVAVALLALDARICVQGPRGVRAIAIDDFFFGPGKTALAPAELIESIDLDCPAAGETSRFLKVGRRQAMEIAVASVAVGLRLRADGTCERARIALGAVGPRPLRAREAERMLEGQRLDADLIAKAAAGAGAACSPRSDVRASADYRRKVVEEGVHRLLSGWTEGTPCRT